MQAVASSPGEKDRATSDAAGVASGRAPPLPPSPCLPGSAETGGPPGAAHGPANPLMSDASAALAAPPGHALPARGRNLALAGQSNGGAAASGRDCGHAGTVAGAEHGAELPEAAARARGAGAAGSTPGTCRDLAKQVRHPCPHFACNAGAPTTALGETACCM